MHRDLQAQRGCLFPPFLLCHVWLCVDSLLLLTGELRHGRNANCKKNRNLIEDVATAATTSYEDHKRNHLDTAAQCASEDVLAEVKRKIKVFRLWAQLAIPPLSVTGPWKQLVLI